MSRETRWRSQMYGSTPLPVRGTEATRSRLRAAFGTRADPSGTSGIKRRYEAEVRRRFRELVASIRNALVDLDALGLSGGSGLLAAASPPKVFEFPRDPAGRAIAFQRWIEQAISEDVLGIVGPIPGEISPTQWQNVYVRSTYSKGAEFAENALRQQGYDVDSAAVQNLFNQPVAAQKLVLIHSRQFEQLRGIGQATSQVISRELTDGLARGIGPREMARNLANATNRIGRDRALLMARTETQFAHAESTIDRYAAAGVQELAVLAEFATVGDDRVCPDCEALEADVFDLNKARGMIPVHPELPVRMVARSQPPRIVTENERVLDRLRDIGETRQMTGQTVVHWHRGQIRKVEMREFTSAEDLLLEPDENGSTG